MKLPVHKLRTRVKKLDLSSGSTQVYHLPEWSNLTHPERLSVMRKIATMRGRDPKLAAHAISILQIAGAPPRDYEAQASALLRWVQENIYYANESGERLQDPMVTLAVRHGDCDDCVILLCALFESIGLPWRQVLSGFFPLTGDKIRWIEGTPIPDDCEWTHVYCAVGTPPFNPRHWYFCEPTVRGVPLGWDIIEGAPEFLPEMQKRGGPARFMPTPVAPEGQTPAALPPSEMRSPAYNVYYGGHVAQWNSGASVSAAVGSSIAESADESKSASPVIDWKRLGVAIATGVAVSVGTQITLDWVRGTGLWADSGSVIKRWVG